MLCVIEVIMLQLISIYISSIFSWARLMKPQSKPNRPLIGLRAWIFWFELDSTDVALLVWCRFRNFEKFRGHVVILWKYSEKWYSYMRERNPISFSRFSHNRHSHIASSGAPLSVLAHRLSTAAVSLYASFLLSFLDLMCWFDEYCIWKVCILSFPHIMYNENG